jgi:hypothetical protein
MKCTNWLIHFHCIVKFYIIGVSDIVSDVNLKLYIIGVSDIVSDTNLNIFSAQQLIS